MSKFQDKLYKLLPGFAQNGLVTLFDYLQYRKRHGGRYHYWYAYFKKAQSLPLVELKKLQEERLIDFVQFARANSPYYRDLLKDLDTGKSMTDWYKKIPIQSKEDIRSNIDRVYTVPANKAIIAKTGGTTGKSLEVRFTNDDIQQRYACLDYFRAIHGYKLGEKVAWFSGKSFLTERDVKRGRYWKYDWLHKIRYYSTFHINAHTIKHYIDNLNKFQPKFAVGFPSSIYEIAKWGIENNYLLVYKMKTIFPTAETIVDHEKEALKKFFGAEVRNQYASSEGAPFIVECEKGNLHIDLISGYFEVLNEQLQPVGQGDLVFTSFTTHGTPLIRYAIRDKLTLSDRRCDCGNNNPLAEAIEGRINDFIFSEERGKINLGNVSNCVKYVKGVVKFQIIQNTTDAIEVKVVKDPSYTHKDEEMFRYELEERLGKKVQIKFSYPENIPRETSGKYRIIKNNL